MLTTVNQRLKLLQIAIIAVCSIFVFRLFYLQVIRYGYYQDLAQASQLRRYEIAAERGVVYAFDGQEVVPVVLNERRYNIVADPEIISNKAEVAQRVAEVVGGDPLAIEEQLGRKSRYEILAKKQSTEIKSTIEQLMFDGDIVGVFAEATSQRVYPFGSAAAQLLGFVDDDGAGRYGVEEALDASLKGAPGRVAALTDQDGIPLLATGDNVVEDPVAGDDVLLSIDIAMQKQLETLLKQGLDNAISESGSAIVMDPYTGQIKAIANYPSYDPAVFWEVEDPLLYTNPAVSSPLEPGSIMKPLTVAAGLDHGSITADYSYFDPGFYDIDGARVENVVEVAGAATRSVSDILRFSLNTGATHVLLRMGGGEINETARTTWHQYMTERYGFGQITGIEQGYEEPGLVPDPTDGFGLGIQYANTTFGQGMTATPLQMAAAIASVINGGTYYQPTLVSGVLNDDGSVTSQQPTVVREDVVSSTVSDTIISYMSNVVTNNLRSAAREGYIVGGKTGTAEVPNPEGGYYDDRSNGTYLGYVGGDRPEYVVMVRVNEPKIDGYAGSRAAGPVFSSITNMLIDNFGVRGLGQ